MAGTELGNEIRKGFGQIGAGVKEAGKKRNAELVAKQGYVSFRNPNAVAMFHSDPDYIDWICKFVDGEYRFYPPENKKQDILALLNDVDAISQEKDISDVKLQGMNEIEVEKESSNLTEKSTLVDTREVVDTYKRTIADPTKTTFISVAVLPADLSKCRYRLSTTDKMTGDQKIIQDFVTNFEGKFAMEVLPSLYNQLMGGFPVMEREKGEVDQRRIAFQDIEVSKVMAFSNLKDSQLELVKNMKSFVDSRYFTEPEVQRGMHK